MAVSALPESTRRRRAVFGAFVGTAIEWYDFFIFGMAAALVFGPLFFPSVDPLTGLLASFATFWVGFLARPLGGILFGHLGDRFGRKRVLVATLFLMGIGTTAIGLLPTYEQVGPLAPVLLVLLRAAQGLAVGGEWAGATLMATESGGSSSDRTKAGMWVQQGSPAGSILATLMFLMVGVLDDDAFFSWGWRVPFLLSAVLLAVGMWIRSRVEESNDFEQTKEHREVVNVPLVHVMRTSSVVVIFGTLASVLGIAAAFFQNTFLISWWTTELGNPREEILQLGFAMAVLQFIWQPISARIAGRWGRERVMIAGVLLSLAITAPYFMGILSGNIWFLGAMQAILVIGACAYYAMLSSFLSAAFQPNVRYTGVALANGLCAVAIGGSTPLIAQTVLGAFGPWGVAVFFALLCVATLVGIIGARGAIVRRTAREVEQEREPQTA
ncbi:Predicted arabinose efflux permease, MFS family [Agrococcus baldri]|uniref:Putative proline/betaine transporter n=1 Tax=Agrococcus baldri TaxID=153730 RepID=A0AA94KYZ1_9MICO|nr:MFS transporter [Agrococcus baldri]SFS04066.1 Predicted arabinose efflux permease, MFS family [Agrococcus baldri]